MTCYDLSGSLSKGRDLQGEIRRPQEFAADVKIQFYSGGGAPAYKIGDGLKLDTETNTLSVDTADAVEQDNTRPVTSAAVFTTVGNIEALLGTI